MLNSKEKAQEIIKFFQKFEERQMIDVFSKDPDINNEYNKYLSQYRTARDRFIHNASKEVSKHSQTTPEEYLQKDIAQFLGEVTYLNESSHKYVGEPQEKSEKRLFIKYFSLFNKEILEKEMFTALNSSINGDPSTSFGDFFKRVNRIFKKDNVLPEKKFLSEQTNQEKELHYKDSSELLDKTKLPFITFSDLPSLEVREDQSRRVLSSTQEAFLNIGLPLETLSINNKTGLLFVKTEKTTNISGSSIQVSADGDNIHLLKLPNRQPKPGTELELDYHLALKETIAHETFHSLDAHAWEKIKKEEGINHNIDHTSDASMYIFNKKLKLNKDNQSILDKTQEVIASIYANTSKEEYEKICLERTTQLTNRVVFTLLQEIVGSHVFQQIPQEDKNRILENKGIRDAVYQTISLSQQENASELLLNEGTHIKNKLIVGLSESSSYIKNMNESEYIKALNNFDNNFPNITQKVSVLLRDSGFVINKNFYNKTDIKDPEFRFVKDGSALSSSNMNSYEKKEDYWTSTIEVMARVAQASIRNTTSTRNSTKNADFMYSEHDFEINKDTQRKSIELFQMLSEKIGIKPIQSPTETASYKNEVKSYFRSKIDGFLNRNAIKSENTININSSLIDDNRVQIKDSIENKLLTNNRIMP